jgi:hypothetical protein
MSPSQRHIIEHALGIGRGDHRNHFVTGPGGDDYADCRALVAMGYMHEYAGHPLTGGDPCFKVTAEGRAALEENTKDQKPV